MSDDFSSLLTQIFERGDYDKKSKRSRRICKYCAKCYEGSDAKNETLMKHVKFCSGLLDGQRTAFLENLQAMRNKSLSLKPDTKAAKSLKGPKATAKKSGHVIISSLYAPFEDLKYITGFGSHVSTEALIGALPQGQNSPQNCPYGLFAEQLSGTAFTAPRHINLRSWLYRIRPSVVTSTPFTDYSSVQQGSSIYEDFTDFLQIEPNQLRWDPLPLPFRGDTDSDIDNEDVSTGPEIDFIDGLHLYCAAGEPSVKEGISVYGYSINASMHQRAMYNSDGDLLIVPQEGALDVTTELGRLMVSPCEICVIPRGIKFSVAIHRDEVQTDNTTEDIDPLFARGYVLETFRGHFELPSLGPIGANGLANSRDFEIPTAYYEHTVGKFTIVNKFLNKFFQAELDHSPFDVVAWHGNYSPYKYDLRKFNTMNSVSFDHPDPSIYTVLTCPSEEPGVAAADFVVFPPRWMVAEHTFRPPYFHRNCMSEFMGMIYGSYDGKVTSGEEDEGQRKKRRLVVGSVPDSNSGFIPGGASLHSCMTAHGPDEASVHKALGPQKPQYFASGMAFMFETKYILKVVKPMPGRQEPLTSSVLQKDYVSSSWGGLESRFDPTNPLAGIPSKMSGPSDMTDNVVI